ncbi:DUF418 domain-containing protein [Anoxynatronum sibiricum]|uniref:DUF418 domain-containing protein n=1 Tax=Anoxynatronum sibiricum TaxID=210623 RepID=A0ABU9VNV0_9CLOT
MKDLPKLANSQRIQSIDMIRGVALFGVFLVNLPSMNTALCLVEETFAGVKSSRDVFVNDLVYLFFADKFYPLFSFLFGASLFLFLDNKKSELKSPMRLLLRRLLLLALFGAFHVLLVWWGDILLLYALTGTMVLLLRNLQATALLKTGLGLLLVPTMMLLLYTGWYHASGQMVDESVDEYCSEEMLLEDAQVYRHGSFGVIAQKRIQDFLAAYLSGFGDGFFETMASASYYLQVGGLMVLGGASVRGGFWRDDYHHHRGLWLSTGFLTFFLGFIGYALFWSEFPLHYDLAYALFPISGPAMAFGYLVLLRDLTRILPEKMLLPFSCLGKMSLTNYLFQTTFGSLLLYGYGLGYYGMLGPARMTAIVVGVYLFQLWASTLWMKRYHQGPMEWVVRRGVYAGTAK